MKTLRKIVITSALIMGSQIGAAHAAETIEPNRVVVLSLLYKKAASDLSVKISEELNQSNGPLSMSDALEVLNSSNQKYFYLKDELKRKLTGRAILSLIVGAPVADNLGGYIKPSQCLDINANAQRVCVLRQLLNVKLSHINSLIAKLESEVRSVNSANLQSVLGGVTMADVQRVLADLPESKASAQCLMKAVVGLPMIDGSGSQSCGGINFSSAEIKNNICVLQMWRPVSRKSRFSSTSLSGSTTYQYYGQEYLGSVDVKTCFQGVLSRKSQGLKVRGFFYGLGRLESPLTEKNKFDFLNIEF